jgi:penicillin G amidase
MISLTPEDSSRSPSATPAPDHSRLFRSLAHLRLAQRHQPDQPRRRGPRRLTLALGLLIFLLIAAVFVASLWLRHAMHASLPQLDGNLRVAGLSEPVTVTRDAQGVPGIQANSLDDVLFAQGFITAQDRLWQMDALRRHAAGELAEILGPSLVDHDRRQRYLQIASAADRALAVLPPDQLHQLVAYANGVNAFMAANPETLPVEFHLLHYTPAPWSPRDTLLVSLAMSEDLATEFPQKLNRELLSAHLPPALLPDLYPVGSWRDRPPTKTSLDLTTPTDEVQQIPLDKTQSLSHPPSTTPQDLVHTFAALNHADCDGCRSGSNNWAVSAARSASGAPLVSNDPHLGLIVPSTWYEAGLHVTPTTRRSETPAVRVALDVTGFTLPGIPFVIAGRNAHVAWGFTNAYGDVQDLRIEHLRGSGPNTEFQLPDLSWSLATHHTEHIRVRGGHDLTLDVLTTTHSVGVTTIETPIISPLYPTERRALSLAWNIYDPSVVTIPALAIDSADSGASLVAALANLTCTSLSVVYADDADHIGFHLLGRIPIRGPAIQRPRATPQFVLPDRTPEEDEQDESAQPRAALYLPNAGPGAPHLASEMWVSSHRILNLIRTAAKPSPKDPDQIPTPPTLPYTIGSPISPVPVDALDPTQVWSGYIPYSALPSVVDPTSGVLATANARIVTDDYPYFIANDWGDPYRTERITRQLTGRTNLRPADMLALENDVHSELDRVVAQRVAYALDRSLSKPSPIVAHDAKRLHQAADLLRAWDGSVTPGSSAAAIVSATRAELWPMLLLPQLQAYDLKARDARNAKPGGGPDPASLLALYTWNERNTALEQLLQHTPARWLPAGVASWDDLLATAVELALRHARAPSDLTTWRYGSLHAVEIAHPIFASQSILSRMLGVPTGTGPHPIGGDNTTIKQTGLHFGPSERFTADLASPDATTANITTGQSGNPASPWYLDQFLPWLNGATFPLPLNHPTTTHTLTLTPK